MGPGVNNFGHATVVVKRHMKLTKIWSVDLVRFFRCMVRQTSCRNFIFLLFLIFASCISPSRMVWVFRFVFAFDAECSSDAHILRRVVGAPTLGLDLVRRIFCEAAPSTAVNTVFGKSTFV